jgi:pectate disaccharide-lyase
MNVIGRIACVLVLGLCLKVPAKTFIAAPNGLPTALGTMGQPMSIVAAIGVVGPGDTLFLRAGVYSLTSELSIGRNQNGSLAKRIALYAYPNERPILDFSNEPYGTGVNPRGLHLGGSYWHIRGLEIKGAADNGMYVSGNNNIVETCITHKNRDTGLQIGRASSLSTKEEWPANNLILNCESFDNYDSPPSAGENADGFACKLTAGSGNVFRGCLSHHNIDDGWDLYTKPETGPIGTVVIDQCIAYANGTLTDGTTNANGDRNGFKLGGAKIAVVHIVTRSVAFANGKNGFTWNSNPGALQLSNNLAFDNAEGNFNFGDNATPTGAVFTNNVSFWTDGSKAATDKHIGLDQANSNCWWDKSKAPFSINGKGLVITSADFAHSLGSAKIVRHADGGLDFEPFQLAAGSKLINAGVLPNGELPFAAGKYYQGNPDLGAVELGAVTDILFSGKDLNKAKHTGRTGRAVQRQIAQTVIGNRNLLGKIKF